MIQPPMSDFRHSPLGRAIAGAAGTALLVCLACGFAAAASEPASGTEPTSTTEPASASEPAARVRAAAEELLRRQLQSVAYPVHILAAGPDARLHLARCPEPLSASVAGGGEPGAHMTVRVSCSAPRQPWAVFVPVTVESDVTVLVLRQSAVRGARLTPAEVSIETRRVDGLAVGYLTDINALPRFTLSRSLPAGAVLTTEAMQADYLVRQGQQVTLIAAAPGINVRATGKALEDGREGARVRVQNLASLKVVQGVVDASGVIEVTP